MWKRTRATEALGLELPIVQGPFGGGNSTVALAAAVSEAGGLGSFGAVDLPPDTIRHTVQQLRARTGRPFSLNLWVPIAAQEDSPVSDSDFQRSLARVAPFLRELGLPLPPPPDTYRLSFDEQVEALLEARPPVFSFVMGVPDRAVLDEARRRGIRTVGTATTVEEAVALEEAGTELIVASGADAGGHRGSFLRPVENSLVGTMSLVPQMASAVQVPVIAAGGIADGRGIAAALALGAEAVQIGTAFLSCPESGAPEVHKRLLGRDSSRWTRLTRAFTGRHARGMPNALMEALSAHPHDLLPYPKQHWLTSPVRKAAAQAGRADLLALWAGQNAASARGLPAAELVSVLVQETEQALSRLR
jgi:nitronate monooxygenase